MLFELDYAGQELCSHAYCVKEKYLGCFVVVTLCPYSAVFHTVELSILCSELTVLYGTSKERREPNYM
jgi:hypothetical protein